MKRNTVFCLYCVIFALISAAVCFAQDWGGTGFDDFAHDVDDIDPDSSFLFDDNSSAGSAFGADDYTAPFPSAAEYSSGSAPASASEDITASAADAAKAAADAAASATAAAEHADAAKAAADAAKTAAESAKVPPASPQPIAPSPIAPQPPVRIVIPMTSNTFPPVVPPAPSAPPAPPPAPPAYRAPPPVAPPPAPPVYNAPIRVIPEMPNPYSNCLYRVQVGAFSNAGLAQQCFSRLRSAGFSPSYEPYNNVNRIVLAGIRAADMAVVVQRLAAAGFNEVWIREER